MGARTFLTVAAVVCLLASSGWALPENSKQTGAGLSLELDQDTYLDVNSLLCFFYNDGNFAYDNANILGKTDGLYYPRWSSKTVIYSAGLWVGAKVYGQERVTVAEYSSEYVPGPMQGYTYMPDNPDFKVYKINRGDTPESNPDYANWPVHQGAPVDSAGDPLILGDQMCWSVFNDADTSAHQNNAGFSMPLGIEIQQTAFAYDLPDSLSKVIFMKYLIINKGGMNLDSTFVSLWCDPDLGGPSDDLVGCDTALSLGYCYNAPGSDNTYGTEPPAVGFDFLQGPVVETGIPSDSAKFMGGWIYGYVNMPMTSFNRYINGIDPHSPEESYNYMRGLNLNGNPVVDNNGDTTKFLFPGDPVTGTGWLDDISSDRRFMMTSGPFNMMPGDTQEIVAAIIVGQGTDRLASITNLKEISKFTQKVFDYDFDVPEVPEGFNVYARSYDQTVELIWDNDMEQDYLDYREWFGTFYAFEGYNVYQRTSEFGSWKKITTFDLTAQESYQTFHQVAGDSIGICASGQCDTLERAWDFQKIYDYIYDPGAGGYELKIVQNGSESGLQNRIYIDHDYINGGPLINGQKYYFAVTPYYLNIQEIGPKDSVFLRSGFIGFNMAYLENEPVVLTTMPVASPGMYTDTAEHSVGNSEGMVLVEVLDPDMIVPGDYTVTFNPSINWNLIRDGMYLLTDQSNQSGDFSYPIIDGIMTRVIGPKSGISEVVEIQSGYNPVDPPDNVFWSWNSTGEYYVTSDFGSGQEGLNRFNWRGNIGWEAWEFRFTSQGSECYDWLTDLKFPNRAPFEVWHFSQDDPTPDRRDIFFIIDDDESGGWSVGDRIYITEVEYPAEPLPQFAGDLNYQWDDDFVLGRVIIEVDEPSEGTIIRFNSTVPNAPDDIFQFTLTSPDQCGDVNQDMEISISDPVYLINYIFINGEAPDPLAIGDANCDGTVNLADPVYLIAYLFYNGNPPCDTDGDGFPDC